MIKRLEVGQKASVTRTFTMEDVLSFAETSGDRNPIHIDPNFARTTTFGRPICHGMLVSSMFSSLLGMELPGTGSVYLGQTLKFSRPVYVGDEVTVTVEIIKIREDKPIVTLRTLAETAEGVVIDGEAVVRAE